MVDVAHREIERLVLDPRALRPGQVPQFEAGPDAEGVAGLFLQVRIAAAQRVDLAVGVGVAVDDRRRGRLQSPPIFSAAPRRVVAACRRTGY